MLAALTFAATAFTGPALVPSQVARHSAPKALMDAMVRSHGHKTCSLRRIARAFFLTWCQARAMPRLLAQSPRWPRPAN